MRQKTISGRTHADRHRILNAREEDKNCCPSLSVYRIVYCGASVGSSLHKPGTRSQSRLRLLSCAVLSGPWLQHWAGHRKSEYQKGDDSYIFSSPFAHDGTEVFR
jgi:hypothetical protein